MPAPSPIPWWDYDFRLADWHVEQASKIAWRHQHLVVRTMMPKGSIFHTMAAYTMHPFRVRGRTIPADTQNVIRAHLTAARRIERRINGHG